MKRGFVNSHQLYASLQDSKVNHKYHNLLEDYLELQKEYVSKKRKFQMAKQKKETLLDEVRFLKQRHEYLRKSQFAKVETKLGPHQNADIRVPVRKERNNIINESDIEQDSRGKEEHALKTPSIEKKPKTCFIKEN